MYTKKRDEKANDKRQAMFNKHVPNKFNKDSNMPKSLSKSSDYFANDSPKKF